MRQAKLLAVAMVLGMFVGCEKKETAKPAPAPAPSAGAAGTTAAPAAPVTPAAGDVTAATKSAATAGQAPNSAIATPSPAPTTASAADTTQAQKLLDETMTYIKENKLDLADKSLSSLEKMKAQLPANWGPKIDQARSALDAARKGNSLKGLVPGSS